ncbi:unnamed protein product [Nyctereutes procyonoides]|uniref:(raccoon dog) hypothetical protein n=1 Tax=Nyctereutes procyonoides TaxID=34880 RepID=A0A811Y0F5_NYCPR|nr:unnamed protein product [Nyctereutes procyonoides]
MLSLTLRDKSSGRKKLRGHSVNSTADGLSESHPKLSILTAKCYFGVLIRRNLQPFTGARSFYKTHAGLFKKILLGLFGALALSVLTCLVFLVLVHHFLKKPESTEHLISLTGICMFILILLSWRAVFWAWVFNWLFGILVIRMNPQFNTFPIIPFFGCMMSILCYLSLAQWMVHSYTSTTATNTLAVARSIFVGLTEAPLLIHLYLADIMPSEIHAVMTGPPASLISASVVAAPSALALSKLVNQRKAKFKNRRGEENNVLEAASNGARDAIVVGVMVGIKFFTNECVAQQLSQYKNRHLFGIAIFTGACVSLISVCVADFTSRTYETYVCCKGCFQSWNGTNLPAPPLHFHTWVDRVQCHRLCCEFYTNAACAQSWSISITVLILIAF